MFPVEDSHLQGCEHCSTAIATEGPLSWPPEAPLAVEVMSLPSTDVAMRDIGLHRT